MKTVRLIHPQKNFLKTMADEIAQAFSFEKEIVVILPSRRASFYFKYNLSEVLKKPSFIPTIYTLEDLINLLASSIDPKPLVSLIDEVWEIYQVAKGSDFYSKISTHMETFERFIPLGIMIVELLEILEREEIEIPEWHLEIEGYPNFTELLARLQKERREILKKIGRTTSGLRMKTLISAVRDGYRPKLLKADRIYFGGILFLEPIEQALLKASSSDEIYCFIEMEKLPATLREKLEKLGFSIEEPSHENFPEPSIHLFEVADRHHSFLEFCPEIKNKVVTSPTEVAIIIPDESALIPLIYELSSEDSELDINVTMGYPLKRSLIASFVLGVLELQTSKENGKYHTPSYLHLLRHPYTKKLLKDHVEGLSLIDRALCELGSPYITIDEIAGIVDYYYESSEEQRFEALKTLEAIKGKLLYPFEKIGNSHFSIKEAMEAIEHVLAYEEEPIEESHIGSLEKEFYKILLGDVIKPIKMAKWSRELITGFYPIYRLIKEIIDFIRVPFVGSPLKGVQVMGFYESNLLSFDKVYIIDANEGILPRKEKPNSLLPEELAIKLKLEEKERTQFINRHIFRRLIKSSREVFIFYSSVGSGSSGGSSLVEGGRGRSRFVEELIWELNKSAGKIEEPVKRIPIVIPESILKTPGGIEKKPWMVKKIEKMLKEREISATFLNTYLKCPVMFYYRYILELETSLSEIEEGLEGRAYREIGILIHQTMEKYFKDFEGKWYGNDKLSGKSISDLFIDLFRGSELYKRLSPEKRFFLEEVAKYRLESYTKWLHEKHPIFFILWVEKPFSLKIPRQVSLTSRMDLVKIEEDTIVIVDYKTGSKSNFKGSSLARLKELPSEKVEEYFQVIREDISDIQLLHYFLVMSLYLESHSPTKKIYCFDCDTLKGFGIKASYHFIGSGKENDYEKFQIYSNPEDKEVALKILNAILDHLLEGLFFEKTDDQEMCKWCDYRMLCP